MFSTLKCRRGEMENTMAQERNADVEAMLIGAAHEIRLALNQGQFEGGHSWQGPIFRRAERLADCEMSRSPSGFRGRRGMKGGRLLP
jgi:hypothetical protein